METPQLPEKHKMLKLDQANTKGAVITNSMIKETAKTNRTGQSK